MYRELRARGASRLVATRIAAHTRRWWAMSAILDNAPTISYFDGLGLPRLDLGRRAP